MFRIILNLFLTGILFGAGPCMLTCGPVLIAYVVGTKKRIIDSILTYSMFSWARIFVYLVLSFLVFFFGNVVMEKMLRQNSRYVLFAGGAFIIIVGVAIILQKSFFKRFKSNSIMLGVIVGALPCVPLLAILSYIGLVSKTWLQSLIYGVSFGIGTFLSPLVIVAFFAGAINKFLEKKKALYNRICSVISGTILIFFGVQLLLLRFSK